MVQPRVEVAVAVNRVFQVRFLHPHILMWVDIR
jgi:hypothetical protein